MAHWLYFALIVFETVHLVRAANYTSLNNVVFGQTMITNNRYVTDYYLGRCQPYIFNQKQSQQLTYYNYTYNTVKGQFVKREEIPTHWKVDCVWVVGESKYEDAHKYHISQMTVCVIEIEYQYFYKKFTHKYFEWYLPSPMMSFMDWKVHLFRTY